MSDYGTDDNDCHSESVPCRNLQTVMDRATDGADVYVTSNILSLSTCIVNSTISYRLQRNISQFEITYPGNYQNSNNSLRILT